MMVNRNIIFYSILSWRDEGDTENNQYTGSKADGYFYFTYILLFIHNSDQDVGKDYLIND